MPTIVFFSTYPFQKSPKHGGQIRLYNIAKIFEKSGWDVISVCVYEEEAYFSPDLPKIAIPFKNEDNYRQYNGEKEPRINDYLTSVYVSDVLDHHDILKKLPGEIDVAHFEQPWLWPLVDSLKENKKCQKTIFVYGSQNIESVMKVGLIKDKDDKFIDDVKKDIEMLEVQAASQSDLCLAVTRKDAISLEQWGATNVIVAQNGVEDLCVSKEKFNRFENKLAGKFVLFVASAHPPNYEDFFEYVGEDLGYIPPDCCILVAGTVCEPLMREVEKRRWPELLKSRVKFLGVIKSEEVVLLERLASAVILPIKTGGGSSLKAASAIYNANLVISTSVGLRGFEEFLNNSDVCIEDTPSGFKSGVFNALNSNVTPSLQERRNELLWRVTLNGYVEELFKLVNIEVSSRS